MQNDTLLSKLSLPSAVRGLSLAQREALCAEIRTLMIRTVSKTGGHLSSSLGAVELAVAIHTVFDSPADKIVWDVGHQAYAHKLLTGRAERFRTLRQEGGVTGFPRPEESVHDAFIAGHSSTSVSAALGLARAMRLQGDSHAAVAVIGDGAFTGGLAFEGLNNAGKSGDNIVVILNHNDMSISKNVGGFARYLTRVRANPRYLHTKAAVKKTLSQAPTLGKPIAAAIHSMNAMVRQIVYRSTMFEDFGFAYLGPIDGHNLEELTDALAAAKALKRPVFVHVNTVKGRGYPFAEQNPGAYHGVSCFDVRTGNGTMPSESFSDVFGKELTLLADPDKRICAVTAAMKYGTGLQHFAHGHRSRFFDVGIAEEHAVTFSAGLAKGGMLPVFAVYSSFLQRSYDQLIHDTAIENTHIVLGIDRAGIVGEDGETHQGMFDVSFLSSIPNTTIFSPSTFGELRACLPKALYDCGGIAALRYPRGGEPVGTQPEALNGAYALDLAGEKRGELLLVTYGRIAPEVRAAAALLREEGAHADMLKLVQIHPLPEDVLTLVMSYPRVCFLEEGMRSGGIAEKLGAALLERRFPGEYRIRATDRFVRQAKVADALKRLGFDAASIYLFARRDEA